MTQNLGLVKLVHVGVTPPVNIQMVWYDSNVGVNIHKYYDTLTTTWVPLNSSTTLFYPNYASMPVPGQTGFLYVDLADSFLYVWDGLTYQMVGGNNYWYETAPGDIRHDGRIGINANAANDPVGNPLSFYSFGRAGMIEDSDVNNQSVFLFGQEVFPGAKAILLGSNLNDNIGQNANISILPAGGVGVRPLISLGIGGGAFNPFASSSVNMFMTPETIDTPNDSDIWQVSIYDSSSNAIGALSMTDTGEVKAYRTLQVGDVNINSLISNGMIRYNGTNFQGYKSGAWHDLDNTALPTVSAYDLLQADISGTLVATTDIVDSAGTTFISIGSHIINDSTGIISYDSAYRIMYGDQNTGISDDPRISFGPTYGNALYRTKNFGIVADLAIDWQNSLMLDFLGTQSIDWNGRDLTNSFGNRSINWENKYLFDYLGNVIFEWHDGIKHVSKWSFNNQTTSLTQTGYTEANANSDIRAMDGAATYTANDLRDILMTLFRDLKTKGILSA